MEIWWGFKIQYFTFPQITLWTQMSNFLVYGPIWIFFLLCLGNSMGISNPICTFHQMTNWTTKVQFLLKSWTLFLWMLSFLFLYYLPFFSFLFFFKRFATYRCCYPCLFVKNQRMPPPLETVRGAEREIFSRKFMIV